MFKTTFVHVHVPCRAKDQRGYSTSKGHQFVSSASEAVARYVLISFFFAGKRQFSSSKTCLRPCVQEFDAVSVVDYDVVTSVVPVFRFYHLGKNQCGVIPILKMTLHDAVPTLEIPPL